MEKNTKKISVVIPVYFNSDEIYTLTEQCIQSLRGYDELVVVFDKDGAGFARTVNEGIRRATGDYVAIVNNDTKMLNGSIREMCQYNALVRPKLVGGDLAKFAFVVMGRDVIDKVGFLDEDFGVGFYEDDDFIDRCIGAGVQLIDSPFFVWHYGGATISQRNPEQLMEKNKKIYEHKRDMRNKQIGRG